MLCNQKNTWLESQWISVTHDFWFVNKSILVAIKNELPDSNTLLGVEDGQIDFYI